MAKIPIEVEKIKRFERGFGVDDDNGKEITEFIVSVREKGYNWDKTFRCNLKELTKLRDEISKIVDSTTTSEKLNITSEKGNILDKYFKEDELCKNCKYKLTHNCVTCVFELQSPLERKLFLALNNEFVKFQVQYPMNWYGDYISIEGKSYDNPKNNYKDVLTIADFYIEKRGVKLCVYTDGHTYHERTEEQAQRDKRIDRKLQELGYNVLRYTGKEVNENIEKIVLEIKNWIEMPTYINR
ncbi:endonuclease domain-containing protein [Aureivirga sp. CE67]|uniref:endonuclease domain-containing protein n=1 Tax=Aureivirga sp. CE67 TaxID=1788983 RepID=UPI0018C936B3|nr:DUF559 domain-containing protein [Aureivirga sp. CE67]